MPEIGWPLPLQTLSPSSIGKFQRCPEQFRRQYILGEWDRTAVSSVVGSAIHESAERNYKQKTTTYSDLSVDDVQIAYAEAFDREVEEGGGPREIDWSMRLGREKVDVAPGRAKDTGVALATRYRMEVAPAVQPVGAEEWFRIMVPGVAVPIRGKIDLIEAVFHDSTYPAAKVDLKFGATAKRTPDNSWLTAAYVYMLVDETSERDGAARVTGIGNLPYVWHTGSWGGTNSKPKIVTPRESEDLTIPYSEQKAFVARANIKAAADMMVAFYNMYGQDEPWPTSALSHTWACNYCTFHPSHGGDCFWWTGAQRETITLI